MSTSAKVSVQLTLEAADFVRQAQRAGQVGEDAMQKVGRAAKSTDQAVSDVGSAAGKMALGYTAALGLAGKAAMDWESQWAGVTKTVDGTTSQLDSLESELRDMAKTMPASHKEITATAEAAGQLGVATDDVTEFTEQMIMLGETTNMTADDAATSIAQISNVLQSAPEDVDNFAAALVDLGNKGASTESEILEMAARVAGAGATIGATEQDVLALSAAMANLGIPAELGGGAVQRVLTQINTDVKSGASAVEDYARVAGVSADEFANAWNTRPVEAFNLLVQGLGRVQDSGGDVASTLEAMGVSGTQNLQVMLRLAGAGDGLSTTLAQSAEAWGENSALAEEFAKRVGTTAAEVQMAWNTIRDAGIDAGGALLPVASEVADRVSSMAEGFQSLPDPLQDGVVGMLAVTAVASGVVWAIGKVVGVTRTVKGAFDTVAESMGRTRIDLDGVEVAAGRTQHTLGLVASRATGVLAVGVAVGALADEMGRVKSQDLDRSLDALMRGETTDAMSQIITDLGNVTSMWNAIDFGEVVTLGGLFGDTSLDKAADNIDAVDQALAQMVETGERAAAQELFNNLVDQAVEAGADVDEVRDAFDAYDLALRNADDSATGAAEGGSAAAGAFGDVGGAAGDASTEVQSLEDALDDLLGAELDQDAALVDWKRSIQSLTSELKGGSGALDANTKKGQDNRDAIRERVEALQNMISADEAAGVGADVMKGKMLRGAEAIVKAGIAAGIGEDAMRGYLEQLNLTPEEIETVIDAQTAAAEAAVRRFDALADAASRDRTMNIAVTHSNLGTPRNSPRGTAPNQTYSDGGFTGWGGKYEPAGLVHKGELVLPQDVVRADWEFLQARYGYLPGFAAGGLVGGGLTTGPLGSSGTDRALSQFTYGVEAALGALDSWSDATEAAARRLEDAQGDVEWIERFIEAADRQLEAAEAQLKAAENSANLSEKALDTAQDRTRDAKSKYVDARNDVATRRELLEQQARVRDLRRNLNATGKDALKGLDRKVEKARLAEAERELRAMRASDEKADKARKALEKAREAEARAKAAHNKKIAAVDRAESNATRRENELEWAREELARAKEVREAAEDALNEAHDALVDSLEGARKVADDAVSAAEDTFKSWQDAMNRVGELAVSRFRPDLFAEPASPWSAAGGGPIFALNEAIAGLQERQGLQWWLANEGGVTGTGFEELMRGSNADIRALIDSGQLDQFKTLWSLYEQTSATVATEAGVFGYGREAQDSLNELTAARAELQRANDKLDEANRTHKEQINAIRDLESSFRTASAQGALAVTTYRGAH